MRRLVFAAFFVAMGLILPALFHLVGMGGAIFLPMHIPVLVGGLVLGAATGAVIGLVTPLLSFLLTGMPPVSPPILPLMVAELVAYGFVAGWLAARRPGGLLVPLVGAMITGRVVLGLAVAVAQPLLGFQAAPVLFVTAALVTGLPGLLVQFAVVPALAGLLLRLPLGPGPALPFRGEARL